LLLLVVCSRSIDAGILKIVEVEDVCRSDTHALLRKFVSVWTSIPQRHSTVKGGLCCHRSGSRAAFPETPAPFLSLADSYVLRRRISLSGTILYLFPPASRSQDKNLLSNSSL